MVVLSTNSWAQTFEFRNPSELQQFFDRYDYNMTHWDSGNRVVPQIYLQNIPERWRKKYANEMSVADRKQFFFFALGPLILKVNAAVANDRQKLLKLIKQFPGENFSDTEAEWLAKLLIHYQVDMDDQNSVAEDGQQLSTRDRILSKSKNDFDELLSRVDIIAPSLALAQAAIETGWGVSRFADVGNALFGQWTWGDDGIKPMEMRTGKGNYRIKAFPTPEESVIAYVHNLNTNNAYRQLRAKRMLLRKNGQPITGQSLAETLVNYSEKGSAYAKTLVSMIQSNKLYYADDSVLKDMEPILLVPVGQGSK